MPNIFKALTTTVAWFLFIWGLILCLIDGFVFPITKMVTMTESYIATGLGIASLILAVVAMKSRKKME